MSLLSSLGPYASFIVASYLAAGLVIAALILWISFDFSRQQRALRDLEASGVRRRSAQSTGRQP